MSYKNLNLQVFKELYGYGLNNNRLRLLFFFLHNELNHSKQNSHTAKIIPTPNVKNIKETTLRDNERNVLNVFGTTGGAN